MASIHFLFATLAIVFLALVSSTEARPNKRTAEAVDLSKYTPSLSNGQFILEEVVS